MSDRYIWMLRNIEQRIRDGYTGRVLFTVDFAQGSIRRVRAEELKLVAQYPEADAAMVGGKER